MSARNEPVLWLQLMAIGAIPLELQLLRLILAGSDLGPVPSVERLLCWGSPLLLLQFCSGNGLLIGAPFSSCVNP